MTAPRSGGLPGPGWADRPFGWVILPLRAFLAVVFLYGGISKIADRRFLDGSSPTSIHATVLAVRDASPIRFVLGPVQDHSFAFGVLMAMAEIAVGIGLLAGLFTRVAAIGGMLLTLGLWLTVSWGAQPWFTSADIVYVFALTPFAIAGAAGVLSVDAWLDSVRDRAWFGSEDRTRRILLGAGAAVVGGLVLGTAALFRRSSTPATARQASSGTATGSSSGDVLAKVADVPLGGGLQVTDADTGDAVWVLQLQAGSFSAFNAACPHQGCPVRFISPSSGFACPCHGSAFDATGKVLLPPATRNLTSIPVLSDGTQIRRQ